MSTQAEAKIAAPPAVEMPVVLRCIRCGSEFITPRLLLFADGTIKPDLITRTATYFCPACQHEFRVTREELLAHARRLDPRELEAS